MFLDSSPVELYLPCIFRFVIDTCRHLKERKQYLIWNAVGCLGITAVRELVKEVTLVDSFMKFTTLRYGC